MTAPIHSLLADELDISEAKAQKLLSAMLREVRKRAHTEEGVRLPDLGKFHAQEGRLTFEPSESLARAVNHRFEGLESEDLSDAPQEDADEAEDDGPSTITLGYQDSSNWTPTESSEAPEASADDDPDEDEADTAEFQVPDAENTGAAAPEATASPDAGPSSTEESAPAASTAADDPTDTEELYPLVEDVADGEDDEPAPSGSAEESTDDTHDTLSDIWESDEDDEDETFPATESSPPSTAEPDDAATPDTGVFGEPEPADEPAASEPSLSEPSPSEPAAPTEADAPAASDASEDTEAADSPPAEPPSEAPAETDGGSSAPRVLVALLVFLLLGGGAWYILGQRGLVPPPQDAVTTLKAQVQAATSGSVAASDNSTSTVPEFQPGEASDSTASDAASPSDADAATTSTASEAGTGDADSAPADASDASTDEASPETAPDDDPAAPDGITPSQGGWSIIVASRTQETAARSLVETYRGRFTSQQIAVDVLEANVDNTTRFRVGVGQFASRSDAERFLEVNQSKLPNGAWPYRLQ
jgi:hypothetical protein